MNILKNANSSTKQSVTVGHKSAFSSPFTWMAAVAAAGGKPPLIYDSYCNNRGRGNTGLCSDVDTAMS